MKKILSIALLLTSISFTTFAQDSIQKNREGRQRGDKKEMIQKSPEEIAKFRTDRLDKTVKLSADQRSQVYALNLKQAQTSKKGKEERVKNREVNIAKRKVSKDELNKILTPEQQKLMSDKTVNHKKDCKGSKMNKKMNKKDTKKNHRDGKEVDRK